MLLSHLVIDISLHPVTSSLNENPVVLVLVSLVLLTYILLAVPMHRWDVYAANKGRAVYLQDNTPQHRQKYEIIMETGYARQAGTTSKVRDEIFS